MTDVDVSALDWNDVFNATDAPKPTEPTARHLHSVPEASSDTPFGLAALRDEASTVASLGEGSRNSELNLAWFRIGQLVHGGELTRGTAHQTLFEAARSCGLNDHEIHNVLRFDATSAFERAKASPRSARRELPAAPHIGQAPTILNVAPTNAPASPSDLEARHAAVRERHPSVDWQHIFETADEQDEFIVDPLVPAGRLIAVFSPPKMGKSLIMLEVGAAIAAGRTCLGKTIDRPRTVLYVDFENDPRNDIKPRLQAMGYDWPELKGRLELLSFPNLQYLDTPDGGAELLGIAHAYGAEVVIIDTISRAVGGEENSNDTWLAFYRNTGLLLKAARIACIRLDHTGKDEGKGMRGGSAKYGDVDAAWQLREAVKGKTYVLDCTHHRMPIAQERITIHRETDPLRHRIDATAMAGAFNAKIEAIIHAMEDDNLPLDAGRKRVRELIQGTITAGNDVVSEAIRTRRERHGIHVIDLDIDE